MAYWEWGSGTGDGQQQDREPLRMRNRLVASKRGVRCSKRESHQPSQKVIWSRGKALVLQGNCLQGHWGKTQVKNKTLMSTGQGRVRTRETHKFIWGSGWNSRTGHGTRILCLRLPSLGEAREGNLRQIQGRGRSRKAEAGPCPGNRNQ